MQAKFNCCRALVSLKKGHITFNAQQIGQTTPFHAMPACGRSCLSSFFSAMRNCCDLSSLMT